MARVISGKLLKASGRIGDVVFYQRSGKQFVRTIPERVNQPNTEKQLAQKLKFKLSSEFIHRIYSFIKIGFGTKLPGASPFGLAMSYNLKHGFKGEYPDIEIDYENFRVSIGKLPGALTATIEKSGKDTICLQWDGIMSMSKASGDDVVAILLVFPVTGYAYWSWDAGKRSDGMVTIKLPEEQRGNTVVGYVSFINQKFIGGEMKVAHISDSCWCGELVFH